MPRPARARCGSTPCSFDPMTGSAIHGREDGDHVRPPDLLKTPIHERTAIPLESALPIPRSEPFHVAAAPTCSHALLKSGSSTAEHSVSRLPQTVNRWTQRRLLPPGSTTRKSVPPSLCRPGFKVLSA